MSLPFPRRCALSVLAVTLSVVAAPATAQTAPSAPVRKPAATPTAAPTTAPAPPASAAPSSAGASKAVEETIPEDCVKLVGALNACGQSSGWKKDLCEKGAKSQYGGCPIPVEKLRLAKP